MHIATYTMGYIIFIVKNIIATFLQNIFIFIHERGTKVRAESGGLESQEDLISFRFGFPFP